MRFASALAVASVAWLHPHAAHAQEGPRPLGNPGQWITTPDYPTDALMDEIEGRVVFNAMIDLQGRVTRCDVIVSSGSESLDITTCNLVSQRAVFSPAKDRRGRPIEGTYTNTVRWVLPDGVKPPKPFEIVVEAFVETNGTVSDCRIVKQEGLPQVPNTAKLCPKNLAEPFEDASGRAVRKMVRTTQKMEVLDAD